MGGVGGEREGDRLVEANGLVELIGDWTTAAGPLYRKLAGAVAASIELGDLPAGERLPSERDLARLLTVSRATVVAAYDELRGRGLVDSVRGSGTRVSARRRVNGAEGRVAGGRATSISQRLVDGPGTTISLAMAIEPAAPEVAEAYRSLDGDLAELMADVGYHPRGYPPLRREVATHYTAAGAVTEPDQVLVTTGAQQAIGLVAQMYLRPGCTVVVESPSWPGCLDVFREAGARLVGVPLDEEGVRTDLLAAAFADEAPVLAYLMPTYHNPTGTLLSAGRRRRVAELAARYNVPVLEDNAHSGFHSLASGATPPPIGAYARGGAEVLTIGSMAKSVWGGLRIGWVRGPVPIVDRLTRYKVRADLGSPVLDQALSARLLPRLAEITAARGTVLRARLEHLQALLAERLPSWRWRSPDGGSALWVELPDTNARIFAQVALRHGVEAVPGSATDPSGAHDNHLRLPFTFPVETITELVDRLTRAWHDLRRHGPAENLTRPVV
ncbi:PLP-dependent aminotransferase family protein [Actinokineospora sp. NBRC 105648]|uniref:aminotransferase-like domain-containing protein n=1 Tax=Actinokineospora sp. NBRC 105648 TaxID=3032206 RepID=UPI0024A07FA0|nr:PLP-dependent aminotransferase family protein [Actinokineospora sp. NBRC 105648]GLZ39735.1 GntR family transcriptional regulator [Actinokineospora sp. NBRC 105648]